MYLYLTLSGRLLCELVRKRERLKASYTRVWERALMHSLRPARAALHKLLRRLARADTLDIFSEPVDPVEVSTLLHARLGEYLDTTY